MRIIAGTGALALGLGLVAVSAPALAAPGDPIGPFNPVIDPLGQLVDGHAANSNFLVFVEGDAQLNADEAEGTVAVGGDLAFNSSYNIFSSRDTFTVPGDARPVFLYVGGGIQWPANGSVLKILQDGYAKVGDTSTYVAFNTDQNNAVRDFRIVPPGGNYETTPRIEGTEPQTPASIASLVPDGLIDIPAAFELYQQTATVLGTCAPTLQLQSRDNPFPPLESPVPPGAAGRVEIVAGQTNVLNITAQDLANLSEITFAGAPLTATSPLVVNITGDYNGTFPNSAGIGGAQAPFILWNFVDAASVVVTGGDTMEGTLYAPRATVNWQVTQNIEGNVIAREFIHGVPVITPVGAPREVHDFPFSAEVSCVEDGIPTPTPTPTISPTPTPTVSPTPLPTFTPTPTPTLSPQPTPTTTPNPTLGPESPTNPPVGPDGPTGPALPATGGGVVGWVPYAGGLALTLGGILLLGDALLRRRRT
ncbi:collagen-binding domain-containing protein [Microbacterium sp. NPDC057407]|uniref:collagen-binding domain-containing protein n=1 Tax=Microbacterium sp. NPDC057407 TaxID=3346120 RepID=UPI0036722892